MVKEIHFKEGVRIKRWTLALEEILNAIRIVQERYDWVPEIVVITSINDSNHMLGSRHYKDEALDIRSKNFKESIDKLMFQSVLGDELGPKFTVLFESKGTPNEHFHVQVKKGEVFP